MKLTSLVVAAAVAAAAVVLPGAATAADVPSFVKSGKSYGGVRSKLKKNWRAIGKALRTKSQCKSGNEQCAYKEARDCAGSGLGNCIMVWEHKKDRSIMEVYTAGESGEVVTGARVAD